MDDVRSVPDIQNVVRISARRPDLLRQASLALGRLGGETVADQLLSMIKDGRTEAGEAVGDRFRARLPRRPEHGGPAADDAVGLRHWPVFARLRRGGARGHRRRRAAAVELEHWREHQLPRCRRHADEQVEWHSRHPVIGSRGGGIHGRSQGNDSHDRAGVPVPPRCRTQRTPCPHPRSQQAHHQRQRIRTADRLQQAGSVEAQLQALVRQLHPREHRTVGHGEFVMAHACDGQREQQRFCRGEQVAVRQARSGAVARAAGLPGSRPNADTASACAA
jgi:hypothetical protein